MPGRRARRSGQANRDPNANTAESAATARSTPVAPAREAQNTASDEEREEVERHENSMRVPKFRPFFLPTPDSRAMTWETWLHLFRFFLDGEGINTERFEKQRIAALYCALGAEGALIGAELCPDDVGYDETVRRLQLRFGNRQSRLYNRAKFFQRSQLDIQDILSYVTELRQLASRCGFGESEEELIRDRLLAGCRVDRIWEKLFLTLTLVDALKVAQSAERALQESGQLGPDKKSGSVAEVGQVRRFQSNRDDHQRGRNISNRRGTRFRGASKGPTCVYCGGPRHERKQCPAGGKTCSRCGKQNYIARVCRSGDKPAKSPKPPSSSGHHDGEEDPRVFHIHTVGAHNGKPERVHV